jgi:hypothetical protein
MNFTVVPDEEWDPKYPYPIDKAKRLIKESAYYQITGEKKPVEAAPQEEPPPPKKKAVKKVSSTKKQ